jgi:putative tryptophan/tyrosine transport system substrate-binding protein
MSSLSILNRKGTQPRYAAAAVGDRRRSDRMKRREFITVLGATLASWSLTARAQQVGSIPIVGYLSGRSAADSVQVVAAFRSGLAERGYTDGKNVTIQFRFADGHYDRLPALANDLVQSNVAVIIATGGGAPSGRAAKVATTTIPIVFVIGGDPIEFGLVSSINHPGGNITGIAFLINELIPKQIEVLAETVPTASAFGFLINPTSPYAQTNTQSAEQAAQKFGRNVLVAVALSPNDFETAYSRFVAGRVGGLLIASEPTFNGHARELAALSARHAIPTVAPLQEFPRAGGLMSYGTSITDAHRQAGIYVARILSGDKPSDLPVQQSVKIDLIVNLSTAKALGLTFPQTLLVRADEVIE